MDDEPGPPPWNGKTVLITGINGYIASTLGLLLLQNGYRLRGTTRSASKAEPLLSGAYALYRSRIELAIIPDMTIAGAFDEATTGVHIIFHVASPVAFHLRTIADVVDPAVALTENILNAALHSSGPQLKAVVVTSSGAAIIRPDPGFGYIFTEDDHNVWALPLAQTVTDDWPADKAGILMYNASKAASDQAMWRFFEEKKPPFSMTSVHPAVVMGPAPSFPASPTDLAEGLQPLYKVWAGTSQEMPPPIGTSSFVDVRDVAEMHLWAALHPEKANGQRYLAAAGYGPAQAFGDILRKSYPNDKKTIVGTPHRGYQAGVDWCGRDVDVWYPSQRPQICGAKIVKHMGLRYRTLEQSIVATVEVWLRLYERS